jgi:uncharacterized protein (DUF1697 family)
MKNVALFKGINVGGKNVVKMDDLKQLFSNLGLLEVKTYIQSGNVIFETDLDESTLQKIVCAGFENQFRFKSNVIIRNLAEMQSVIAALPFSMAEIVDAEASDTQVEHLYVHFFDHIPEQIQFDCNFIEDAGQDFLRIGKREAYLLCHQSIRKSKLAIKAAKVLNSSTVRNWKTVNKLYDMMIS